MGRVTLLLPLWLAASLQLLASGAGVAAAQDTLAVLREQIGAASRLRIRTADGWGELERARLIADSVSFAAGWLMAARSGRRTTLAPPLPLPAVREIAVPAGTNAGKGALIGGGIGALLGAVLVVGASTEEGSFQPSASENGAAFAVTTALGAGIGALMGAASSRWRVVYPAPTEPR